DEINNLQPSVENKFGKSFKVIHTLYCTMIDGKVCNVLTDQKSTTSCNICGVNPKNINDLQYIKELQINEEYYKKKQIQEGLKSQLSITVDVVKQRYGTTNDGNTARRFFLNPEIVSNVLGINQALIERF
ncbi:hypothetical protein EAG_09170, partial [Camponotus floridanus]